MHRYYCKPDSGIVIEMARCDRHTGYILIICVEFGVVITGSSVCILVIRYRHFTLMMTLYYGNWLLQLSQTCEHSLIKPSILCGSLFSLLYFSDE